MREIWLVGFLAPSTQWSLCRVSYILATDALRSAIVVAAARVYVCMYVFVCVVYGWVCTITEERNSIKLTCRLLRCSISSSISCSTGCTNCSTGYNNCNTGCSVEVAVTHAVLVVAPVIAHHHPSHSPSTTFSTTPPPHHTTPHHTTTHTSSCPLQTRLLHHRPYTCHLLYPVQWYVFTWSFSQYFSINTLKLVVYRTPFTTSFT